MIIIIVMKEVNHNQVIMKQERVKDKLELMKICRREKKLLILLKKSQFYMKFNFFVFQSINLNFLVRVNFVVSNGVFLENIILVIFLNFRAIIVFKVIVFNGLIDLHFMYFKWFNVIKLILFFFVLCFGISLMFDVLA